MVSDNGRGIDAEDIHRKALEKGLVDHESFDKFTKKEKFSMRNGKQKRKNSALAMDL